jgi:site-specific recombinase XerD
MEEAMPDLPILVGRTVRGAKSPAKVYLAGLAKSGRRTVDAQLRGVARMVGAGSIDEVPWHLLKHEHVVALKTKALELGKSPATVNLMLAGIRGAVRTAWNMGMLSAEELARIEAVKGVKAVTEPKGRRITSGELGAIMKGIKTETASGKRDAAIIAFAYCGGLRRQEIAALQLENVNDLGEELEITIKSGKGRKDRVLFLNNGGGDAVNDYLLTRGDSPGFLFWSSLKGGKMVPESKMTDQAVYARIKRCAKVAGLKPLSPHDMRRSFVSDMLDNGVDISTVAAMAGHSSVSTTQRYDRRGDEAKRKAAKALHLPYPSR